MFWQMMPLPSLIGIVRETTYVTCIKKKKNRQRLPIPAHKPRCLTANYVLLTPMTTFNIYLCYDWCI